MTTVSFTALAGMPEVTHGDDVGELIVAALHEAGLLLRAGDIVVVAHKVVSKAEGAVVRLDDVPVDDRARALAAELNKDPRKLALVLRESSEIVRTRATPGKEGLIITRHKRGFICANAGVDESNVADGWAVTLPVDPDASARRIRARLIAVAGVDTIGVIISDTFGRPWRYGQTNVAIGLAGVPALRDLAGEQDGVGKTLRVTMPAIADEIAAGAGLVMEKAAHTPAILVRGANWRCDNNASIDAIIRNRQEDLF